MKSFKIGDRLLNIMIVSQNLNLLVQIKTPVKDWA